METTPNIRYIAIRDYSLKELAGIYQISKYKMRNKLKKIRITIGEREGYFFKYAQVAKIFALEPLPPNIHLIT